MVAVGLIEKLTCECNLKEGRKQLEGTHFPSEFRGVLGSLFKHK